MSSRCSRSIGLALVLLPALASATAHTWPGVAPCNATLQVCVNGLADGARIEIATNTPISEDISLYSRSLTLTAADGYTPAFGTGHWLSVTSSGLAGDLNVSVSKLSFTDGYLFANYNGTGTANYDFEDLTLTRASSTCPELHRSRCEPRHDQRDVVQQSPDWRAARANYGLIELYAGGATLNATAYYNHVTSTVPLRSPAPASSSTCAPPAGTAGGGTFKLHGNECVAASTSPASSSPRV